MRPEGKHDMTYPFQKLVYSRETFSFDNKAICNTQAFFMLLQNKQFTSKLLNRL